MKYAKNYVKKLQIESILRKILRYSIHPMFKTDYSRLVLMQIIVTRFQLYVAYRLSPLLHRHMPNEDYPQNFQFCENDVPPELRAQRTLNKSRIPKWYVICWTILKIMYFQR